ncbi:MAG: transketolase C-terminal domain-containing protein, partial [Nitrospinota bacterium]
ISACLERIHRKIASKEDEIIRWEEFMLEDAEVAIFSFGATARSAKAAVRLARAEEIRAGLFRAITIWPFPEKALSSLAQRVGQLVVAETHLCRDLGGIQGERRGHNA